MFCLKINSDIRRGYEAGRQVSPGGGPLPSGPLHPRQHWIQGLHARSFAILGEIILLIRKYEKRWRPTLINCMNDGSMKGYDKLALNNALQNVQEILS